MNPEFRQTLSTLTHNFESANQAAQENIYTFTQLYIDPCLSGFTLCLQDCTALCLPNRDDNIRRRRARGRSRGRAETFFDFYDDWEEDEINAGNLGWRNDELDNILAGRGSNITQQPKRPRAMSYGTRGRARGGIVSPAAEQDPTIIPGSSYLGFLERLPWRLGQRVLKYQPSAANLQENPGGLRLADAETQPLLEEGREGRQAPSGQNRTRSNTQSSRSTQNSMSSRGDLIMSEEEEDAHEIDEEFAIMLGRRTTNTGPPSEDHSSGKTGSSGRRPGPSRRSTRTASSKSIKSTRTPRSVSQKSLASLPVSPTVEEVQAPSLEELRQEEAQAKQEEEMEIALKREAAQKLAVSVGLAGADAMPTTEAKPDREVDTEPFPSITDTDTSQAKSSEIGDPSAEEPNIQMSQPPDPPPKGPVQS